MSENRTVKGVELNYSLCSNYKLLSINVTDPIDSGDASVPDTFDVHAFFYSEDAPALESELHNMFADKRVNLINKRKEFFHLPFNHVIDAIDNGNFEVQRTL
jgi:hypothetical protein